MNQNSSLIDIDGSYGEGGGQILRTALSLSSVLKKPFFISNIRKNRKNPGLAPQHLAGIKALSELYNAKVEGDEIGSKEIIFEPHEIFRTDLEVEIETAGSIILVLQTLLLPALLSQKEIKIKFRGGATDTFFSPTIDYFRFVAAPVFKKIVDSLPDKKGGEIKIDIKKRGFYPEGGAEVEAGITPLSFSKKDTRPLNLTERGELKKILIVSGASESLKGRKVAEGQLNGAHQTPLFYKKAHLPLETRSEYYDSKSSGSQITIIGEFENTVIGASSLGKIGKSSEDVGREAAMEFLKETRDNNVLDSHLVDQILPFVALFIRSAKITTSDITQHVKTNILAIKKFVKGKFEIDGNLIKWYS